MGDGEEFVEAIALRGELVEVAFLGKPHVADLVGLCGVVVNREPRLAGRDGGRVVRVFLVRTTAALSKPANWAKFYPNPGLSCESWIRGHK